MIDMERGARTSGSRFTYLLGDLVRLHVATVQYALDKLVGKGFTPVMPPVLVREEALVGTGFFPEAREQVYAVANADPELFLVGTSEVSLAALHMGEILPEAGPAAALLRALDVLPARGRHRRARTRAASSARTSSRRSRCSRSAIPTARGTSTSTCSRSSARSPTTSGLHYRVMNISVGDLGAPAAKKYDIEAWLPGQGRYRELTSCSNTTDYQARRLDARFRSEKGVRHLHTLNGTAITSSRTLIAVLETHQESDGSVSIPEVLQGFGAPAEIRAPR